MDLHEQIYSSLSTTTKRALAKKNKWGPRKGKPYYYHPRITLINRISEDFGLSMSQSYEAMREIRYAVLKQIYNSVTKKDI